MNSAIFENSGDYFKKIDLPLTAQFSSIRAIAVLDNKVSGKPTIILGGNYFGSMTEIGRMDAGSGLIINTPEKNVFNVGHGMEQNLDLRGQCSSLQLLKRKDGSQLLIAAFQNHPLRMFKKIN